MEAITGVMDEMTVWNEVVLHLAEVEEIILKDEVVVETNVSLLDICSPFNSL